MVSRDEQGWITPTRSLPYQDDVLIYRTINGAQVNQQTGEIDFYMIPWSEERSPYQLARSEEFLGHLLVSQKIKNLFEKERITGVFYTLWQLDLSLLQY